MMPIVKSLSGDAIAQLATLPDESVHCCVTSPPYWGLRSYLPKDHALKPLEIGLEPTPELYVKKLVEVFREVRRVLREDGTCWINLGDSYSRMQPDNVPQSKNLRVQPPSMRERDVGLPPKNLVGIPWRVAFALQADGWYLRSDIIWAKPNPMPESVTDRPTKAHEYLFLLAKSQSYFYDAKAIAEPVQESSLVRAEAGVKFGGENLCQDTRLQSGKLWIPKAEGANSRINRSRDPNHEHEYEGKHRAADDQASGRRLLKNVAAARANGGDHDSPFGITRNKRTVWAVPTSPYRDAHFATFPPDLIKPCIMAGCPVGGTVLDPFGGSGTVGQVALELGRSAILIDLNPAYAPMQDARTNVTPGLPL